MTQATWLLFRQQEILVENETLAFPAELLLAVNQPRHVIPHPQPTHAMRVPVDVEAPTGYSFVSLRHLLLRSPREQFELAATASQVLDWADNHRFCSRCGTATEPHPRGERAAVCPACDYHQYPRINPCVIVAITRGDTILLARPQRFNRPMYSLLAGFVEAGETLEQAVHREVAEEAGIQVHQLRYFGSQSWPFPHNLMLAFQAEWLAGDLVLQEEELMDGQFFHYRQLPEIPPSGSIAHQLIMTTVEELARRYG